jgi:RNA polymerase sigma-54 factor
MSVSLRLDLRQSQSLVMTPQLQQAIKLLQLSNLELVNYVQQELEQNPFLEQQEADGRAEAPAAEPEPARSEPAAAELSGAPAMADSAVADDGWSGAVDDGWADPGQEAVPNGLGIDSLGRLGGGGSADFGADDEDGFESRLNRPKSLREHLEEQLAVDLPPGPERLIGLHLIDLVDDTGYLRSDLGEVADRLGCELALVEQVLARLQQFDPSGVFARDLAECLALQLRDRNRLDPAMAQLLCHLECVARADFPALMRHCGVQADDLSEMIAELKALDPRPGLRFAHTPIEAVVPDVIVQPVPGGWRVELNAATLPRLIVNNAYVTELRRHAPDQRAREFMAERLQSANWLIKALDQRARTLLRVAEAVVERQSAFLSHGITQLKPLILKDIAEKTELHESTVSRATAEKWVATPRGDFPFRYFFSNALPGTAGEDGHSSAAIREQIKALIDNETPSNILSDDQIVEVLRARGVAIARRTVAKYRESLSIPSSVQRKRAKALKLA